ncbi:hypothetical protein V8E36_005053 [Tilletia maclaganii]
MPPPKTTRIARAVDPVPASSRTRQQARADKSVRQQQQRQVQQQQRRSARVRRARYRRLGRDRIDVSGPAMKMAKKMSLTNRATNTIVRDRREQAAAQSVTPTSSAPTPPGPPKVDPLGRRTMQSTQSPSPPTSHIPTSYPLGEDEQHRTSRKELWGEEAARAEVPESIAQIGSTSHLTTILLADPAPHGLLGCLAAHSPQSSLLGLIAPPTPFGTDSKHNQTLLFPSSLDSDSSSLSSSSQGAIGIVFIQLHLSRAEERARRQTERR